MADGLGASAALAFNALTPFSRSHPPRVCSMTSFRLDAAITSQAASSLAEALALLEQRLGAWAADDAAFAAVLQQAYGVDAGSAEALALRSSLLGEGLGLSLVADPLDGLLGAYAAADGTAPEVVVLNSTWLAGASAAELEAVLLEELGHAIDQRLKSLQKNHLAAPVFHSYN